MFINFQAYPKKSPREIRLVVWAELNIPEKITQIDQVSLKMIYEEVPEGGFKMFPLFIKKTKPKETIQKFKSSNKSTLSHLTKAYFPSPITIITKDCELPGNFFSNFHLSYSFHTPFCSFFPVWKLNFALNQKVCRVPRKVFIIGSTFYPVSQKRKLKYEA